MHWVIYWRLRNEARLRQLQTGSIVPIDPYTLLDSHARIHRVKATKNERYAKFPWSYGYGGVGLRGRDALSVAIRASIHQLERGHVPMQVLPQRMFPDDVGPCCRHLNATIRDFVGSLQAIKDMQKDMKGKCAVVRVPTGKDVYAHALAAVPDFLAHADEHKDIVEVCGGTMSSCDVVCHSHPACCFCCYIIGEWQCNVHACLQALALWVGAYVRPRVDHPGVSVEKKDNLQWKNFKFYNVVLSETLSTGFGHLSPAVQLKYYVLEMLLEVMFNGIRGAQHSGKKLASLDLHNALRKIKTNGHVFRTRLLPGNGGDAVRL